MKEKTRYIAGCPELPHQSYKYAPYKVEAGGEVLPEYQTGTALDFKPDRFIDKVRKHFQLIYKSYWERRYWRL